MKRKLISYICLVAIFMETIPVNALSNITSEIVPIESSEETKSEEESTEQKEEKTEEKEDKQKEESKSKLEDNVFNMYILDKIENELGFSIGFDEKEKKFKLSNQSEKQLSKTNLDSIIYKINIYDKENKEKLNIELLGKDTGNSEKLNILKDTKYETGDTIKIASFDPKKGIKILGEIKGDINKEKQTDKENEKVEDYSDGVDNLDYIENVRYLSELIKTSKNVLSSCDGCKSDLLKQYSICVDELFRLYPLSQRIIEEIKNFKQGKKDIKLKTVYIKIPCKKINISCSEVIEEQGIYYFINVVNAPEAYMIFSYYEGENKKVWINEIKNKFENRICKQDDIYNFMLSFVITNAQNIYMNRRKFKQLSDEEKRYLYVVHREGTANIPENVYRKYSKGLYSFFFEG